MTAITVDGQQFIHHVFQRPFPSALQYRLGLAQTQRAKLLFGAHGAAGLRRKPSAL